MWKGFTFKFTNKKTLFHIFPSVYFYIDNTDLVNKATKVNKFVRLIKKNQNCYKLQIICIENFKKSAQNIMRSL